ncbi:LCP family glycopolymer transferase [Gracilibacillus salinarum]|uniref:LCP family protein n=1 Tax=Gracilibacillus salinarum TaxID=2932255 RepID=A0ABY4GS80_9BACI|nr:LCP family protein [Gracilibacillus salinarum]UOQ87003.1 LCP family protein [Gracilibacillus salinarum]
MTKRVERNKKSKRWLKVTLAVIVVVILSIAGYVYSIYHNAQQTVEQKVHEEVETIDTTVTKKKIKDQEPLNVLLLGVDERSSDSGRSDALMVLSLDPDNDAMQLVSIPRDTRTEIVGRGTDDKINHAYAFGGVDMSINTVENFLDIELDYYVRMNMEGLSNLVDALGGITVNNKLDWNDTGYYKKGYHYAQGDIQLDGPQTMGYVRMRYQDPNGDFGRTERQRQVIKAVVDKGASFNSVGKINNLIDVLGNNVVTNMEFKDMTDLFTNYRNTRQHFTSYMMQGSGTKISGIYYLMVTDEEVNKVHNMLIKSES